jgi:hypothetical protein
MSPRWGSKPRRTDRLVVSCNVTLYFVLVVSAELSVQSWSLELTVTSQYSGRAAVFREELQSCRRMDPAIMEDRKLVKIQCEDIWCQNWDQLD